MSNPVEKQPTFRSEADLTVSLGQWIRQAIDAEQLLVKFHQRGNNLHILFEGNDIPDRVLLLQRFILALQQIDMAMLVSGDRPQIYQIQLYACQTGRSQPVWTSTIYLNQLESHLAQLQAELELPATIEPVEHSPTTPHPSGGSALALSNRSLARQGNETAIASYLSETLSRLGVAVRVSVKTIPFVANSAVYSTDISASPITTKRLWIACDAPYSPESSLIGEAVTQKLRELEITGYRDAIIRFQVTGETKPDWLLRVDLTPPEEMLREWARWGDVEAIQRLLNQAIAHFGYQFSGVALKEQTLHLICQVMPHLVRENPARSTEMPEQTTVLPEIIPILEKIAPQGIHAAAVYGQLTDRDQPGWMEWLNLPAAMHPALSQSALTLAQQEDWEAIAFLLHRLLNARLDDYLATGGIRLKLLPKQDLLHIMSEAAVCPDQRQVGDAIVRFLESLKLPNIAGVRIYGRRSGQKHPMWNYGVDFAPRDRIVPEVAPEFAATDAYVDELISQPHEPILRPDLSPTDLRTAWTHFQQRCLNRLQTILLRSHLFISETDADETQFISSEPTSQQGTAVMMVWGAVGVLLMLQANWMLGNALRANSEAAETAASPTQTNQTQTNQTQTNQTQTNQTTRPIPSNPPASVVSSTKPIEEDPAFALPEIQFNQAENTDADAFNAGGFTEPTPVAPPPPPVSSPTAPTNSPPPPSSPTPTIATSLPYTPQNPALNLALAETLAAESDLPNFNSRQFNDKLSLYYHVLQESGTPDVLIVGSSRALRGVDPAALETALAELGYGDVTVFNFGINGATAQVVELLLRQVLTPDQLPRLILWADGARAFNSNAEDVTYNGIVASEAYQKLTQGTLILPTIEQIGGTSNPSIGATGSANSGLNVTLTDSYQSLDRFLSRQLARASGLYEFRDRLKQQLQQGVGTFLPTSELPSNGTQLAETNLPVDYELVDAAGFLSLGIQFNPATYYQQYARVTGTYDRDYSNFRIPGVQQDALLSVLRYTQTQQIPIVFVNLPLTDEYLDTARLNYEQDFREYMVRLGMEQSGFIFRDFGRLWTEEYDYFSDPSHLNRYGAYAVSRQLAQDPLIPWNPSR